MSLIGPCMFAAPLAAVLAILALPLWPVAIVVLAVLRLVFWPVALVLSAFGYEWGRRVSSRLAAWLRIALRPWTFFDPPKQNR